MISPSCVIAGDNTSWAHILPRPCVFKFLTFLAVIAVVNEHVGKKYVAFSTSEKFLALLLNESEPWMDDGGFDKQLVRPRVNRIETPISIVIQRLQNVFRPETSAKPCFHDKRRFFHANQVRQLVLIPRRRFHV